LKSKTVQEFKETEIGKIPTDWDVRTIKECSSEEPYSTQIGPFGKALMSSEYTISGVPVLRGINVNLARFHDNDFVFVSKEKYNELKKFEAFPDDILLVHKGSIGKIGLMPLKRKFSHYLLGNSMMRVKCEKTILLPKFLYFWLSSVFGQNYLYSRISQVGVPQLQTPLRTLREAKLALPSITEQQQIVDTLFSVEESINNLKNQNKILEQIAQAIFQSWFVDFDGVTEFEDSELGKIPKGWTVGTIGDFGKIITGKTPSTKNLEYYGKEYSFITIPDMHDKTWILKTERYLSEIAKKDFSKYFLPKNSVLVSCIATVGLVSVNHQTALTNQQINSIACSKNIPYTFVYCTMTRLTDQLITWASGGSATPNLNKTDFSSIPVLIPHSKVLENFHNILKNLFEKIQKNLDNIIHLTKTRDMLIPKLMSGEIRV